MNRYDFLKRLKDKISQLVAERLDEDTIFAQLHTNPFFANVSRLEVHSFYKNLKAEFELEAKKEREIAETGSEMNHIKKSYQSAKSFLVYGYHDLEEVENNVWQSRFVVTGKCKSVEVYDLFHDKPKSFKAEVSSCIKAVQTLTYPFLLLIVKGKGKKADGSDIYYFHLARFDPENDELQLLQRIAIDHYPRYNDCIVLVDSFDASKFVLVTEQHAKAYKLVDGQIQFGKFIEKRNLDLEGHVSYYNDHIYDLQPQWDEDEQCYDFVGQIEVKIYDLEQDENETIKLNSLPNNLSFTGQLYKFYYNFDDFVWVRDYLFAFVKFQSIDSYGVAFTNLQKKGWTVINFASYSRINQILFISGKDLIIYTEDSKNYKLPICKPDSLRNMAWLKLVNLSKQAGVEDPYDEARQYLPLNSNIQPFVFTEE